MKRYRLILIMFLSTFFISYSFEIKLDKQINVSGGVLDIVYYQDRIITSTEKGIIEIINPKTGKIEKKIELPKIKSFMGEQIFPKIFSVDVYADNIVMVSEATGGNRDIFFKGKDNIKKINLTNENLQYTKVRFWGGNYILLTTKGSELILYDYQKNKIIYRKQISSYSFGDFNLCDNKRYGVLGDEGGSVYLIDLSTGNVLKKFDKVNVDQIYRVDCKSSKIITGGRDRRIGYYDINTNNYKKIEADFIVFSVALSPDGKIGVYQINESNDLGVYDFSLDKRLLILKGHKSTVGVIDYVSQDLIISGSDDGKIIIWRIKR
ncbi:MAG: hypothetical protein ABWJ98_00885 [Hydrogenothermaceae bacterium]